MPRLIPLLLLVLAGCAAVPPAGGLHDPGVPVRSLAGYDLNRLAGPWHEVAHLAPAATPACPPGGLTVGPGLAMGGRLCLGGRAVAMGGQAVVQGPGRFALAGRSFWVLWADHGDRTLVLGDPAGGFAVVLDRGRISPDRLAAAREVLDFNGFDIALLR